MKSDSTASYFKNFFMNIILFSKHVNSSDANAFENRGNVSIDVIFYFYLNKIITNDNI
jgi:hypothetical protein